ncbi:YihY/virulence factor BrkB family protein [Vallitalea sp.]|jgi:membrane protein|uniref:YihY/virulence factor BrkB family protein n=1 Tax=Vallitalea sp. TaxID=1882829 RepID=UPI0025F280E8|nr:YihY/virulence factor BrkB family protein [Vallitalea sp.]MCT4685983.1 YihY/virulence factor BrkB family protein [Vallitalea sp.]
MNFKKATVFVNLFKRIQSDDITAWASKLTFYILLSIFPFILFLMQILSYTSLSDVDVLYQFKDIFPDEIFGVIGFITTDIEKNQSDTLLSIALIATIWAASKGIMAIITSLNKAYREKETRSYIFLRLMSFIYTIAFAIVLILTFLLIIFWNKLLNLAFSYIYLPTGLEGIIDFIRILFAMILLFFFFILLYNASPNKKITFIEVVPGAILSTIGWLAMSFIFSFYIDKIGNFSYMYGSLASIIILLIWLYLCSIIILVGGELNAIYFEKDK